MAKQGFIGWLLGEPEDTFGGIPAKDQPWLHHNDPPSVREIRTGQRFRDGGDRAIRDTNSGKYVKQTSSPRETARVVREQRAQGNRVIVEKVTHVESTDGGNGCMVIILTGGAALVELLYFVGKAVMS